MLVAVVRPLAANELADSEARATPPPASSQPARGKAPVLRAFLTML